MKYFSSQNLSGIFPEIFTVLFLISGFLFCQMGEPRENLWKSQNLDKPKEFTTLLNDKYTGPKPKIRKDSDLTSIIVHSTKGYKAEEYLRLSWKNGWNIHFLFDKNGNFWGDPYAPIHIYPTAPGMDKVTIHIALEGTAYETMKNKKQWDSFTKLVESLAKEYNIPKTNHDITSKKGIFTHNQSKKRYGGFISLKEFGEEKILEKLLKDIKGKYYSELKWKGRFDSAWVFRKEDSKAIKAKFRPNRGRGITPTPKAELKNIEQTKSGKLIESHRVKYEHRGKISPSCVVLHFTAIPSFFSSLKVLEDRSLTASIMVDKDGKAYQLLDSLVEKPSTAYGTNDNCVQIEIVGRHTKVLMKNTKQTKKVVQLVKELSQKYKFPLNNHKIESFSGVFSHTQAKKKFGGSSFLIGKDFDPGEEYMEQVLRLSGGKYYPEEKWFERQSENWVILDREFQP